MSDMSYSIRIVDGNGNGIPDEEVTVFYFMTHDSGFTDNDGWVTFEKHNPINEYVKVKVYFRDEIQEIDAGDGETFSFTYNIGDEDELEE